MGVAAMTVVGTLVSTVGAVVSGIGQANAARYQAEVARQNQRIAESNARMAAQAGQQEEFAQGQKGRAAIGAAKSAFAGAGLDVNTAGPAAITDALSAMSALDSMTTKHNTALNIRGWKTRGLEFGAEAQMQRNKASNAMLATVFNAGSSLLGGAGSYVSQQNRNNLATGAPMNFGMRSFG